MAIGAALAPMLAGAGAAAAPGVGAFLPAALSAAPKVAGLLSGAGAGGPAAANAAGMLTSPFDIGANAANAAAPPVPEPNPAMHDMGLFGGGQTQPKNPAAPAGVSKTMRPMLASDMLGPGQTQPKNPMDNDAVLIADERNMSPEAFAAAENAAGVGLNTSDIDKSPYSSVQAEPVTANTEDIDPYAAPARPAAAKPPMPVQNAQRESGDSGLFSGAFEGLGQGVEGLQEWLGESQTNPLFQTGMGLLAAGNDSRVNPYTAINSNLASVQPGMIAQQNADISAQKQAQAAAKQAEEEKFKALMAAVGMKYDPAYSEKSEPRSQQSKGRASVIRR